MIDLKALRKAKKMNQQEMAELLSCDQSFVSQIENGKRPLPNELAERLQEHFGVSLLAYKLPPKPVVSEVCNKYNIDDENILLVPLVSKYAYAGYLNGFGDDEYIENLPTIPFYVDREYKGKYMCFEVRGDSMDDGSIGSFPEGSRLLARNVGREHWINKLHINSWDFIIVHSTEGILVKRLIEHKVEQGIITCHSLNNLYSDFELHLDEVVELYNIVQKIIPTKR